MNYKDKFQLHDRVEYQGKKATIVHVHEGGLVNLKVDNDPYYVFGVHAPYSLKLI
jgi:hypothetical protein